MHNIETINKLLIDELSATETYQQALNKFQEDHEQDNANSSSRPVFSDHIAAVSSLDANSEYWAEVQRKTQALGLK